MSERPERYNQVTLEGENVYGSYTLIGDEWIGALFAKRDIMKSEHIAEYVGKIYSIKDAEKVLTNDYMFSAHIPSDKRRRVIIDGNPDLYQNIAGLANYAEGKNANAIFHDRVDEIEDRSSNEPYVTLTASEFILKGVEIRVDYDRGSRATPFRDQMIRQGISPRELRSAAYKQRVWVYPRGHSMATTRISGPQRHTSLKRTLSTSSLKTIKRPRGRPPKNAIFDSQLGKYVVLD
jgi:hypothetical protein